MGRAILGIGLMVSYLVRVPKPKKMAQNIKDSFKVHKSMGSGKKYFQTEINIKGCIEKDFLMGGGNIHGNKGLSTKGHFKKD